MTVHDRWFIMPATTVMTETGDVIRPKYHDTGGIIGFSGTVAGSDVVSAHYPALAQMHPDVNNWYIVRMYGEDNAGWSALNEIHNKADTRTLADHAADVAPVLNNHFPGLSRAGGEWADSFRVSRP